MPPDLTTLSTSELVDLLIKDTEYYMDLCKAEGNDHNRKLVENHIELLTAEIKSRDGDKEILQDGDISSKTAE